jgi:hypothetical protein
VDPVRFLAWLVIAMIGAPLLVIVLAGAFWVTLGVLAHG